MILSRLAAASPRALGRRCIVEALRRHISTATKREPLLMTPGPLTTSSAVKQAMLVDYGSRDARFLEVMHQVRTKLLGAANVSKEEGYECVIMRGAGTYGIEAVLGSVIPRDGRVLILSNGAYGKRQQQICTILGIPFEAVDYGDHEVVRVEDMLKKLK